MHWCINKADLTNIWVRAHFPSGNFDVLGELLSNLKWLLSTVEFGAANALLACYRDYRNQVPERVSAYNCMYMHYACQCSATCTCTCTCTCMPVWTYKYTYMYHCHFPQFSVEVQHFEMFLSGHMYALTNQPPREDVLQLALLVPGTSEVNRQAKGIVHNERKRSWFDWT